MRQSAHWCLAWILVSVLGVGGISAARAEQEASDRTADPEPKTVDEPKSKYEVFVEEPGTTLTSEFFEMPDVRATNATVAVELIRSGNLAGKQMMGLRIAAKFENGLWPLRQGYLDQDEIAPAAAAVEYMLKTGARIRATSGTITEIRYTGRGGVVLAYFWDPRNNRSDQYIRIGHRTVKVQSLENLQEALSTARRKLEDLKPGK